MATETLSRDGTRYVEAALRHHPAHLRELAALERELLSLGAEELRRLADAAEAGMGIAYDEQTRSRLASRRWSDPTARAAVSVADRTLEEWAVQAARVRELRRLTEAVEAALALREDWRRLVVAWYWRDGGAVGAAAPGGWRRARRTRGCRP